MRYSNGTTFDKSNFYYADYSKYLIHNANRKYFGLLKMGFYVPK